MKMIPGGRADRFVTGAKRIGQNAALGGAMGVGMGANGSVGNAMAAGAVGAAIPVVHAAGKGIHRALNTRQKWSGKY
jgi:hypothetical protein